MKNPHGSPVKKGRAIYPGSFDPITNGHVDIIERSLKVFDEVVVAVLENPKKAALFSTKERVDMIREIFGRRGRVRVRSFHGLLVEFARAQGIPVVIRGLRAISDFEYELQMALMNRNLAPDIETFFMMPNVKYSFLSSNLVREVVQLGGPVDGLVPGPVERRLRAKIKRSKKISIP
jgi:pantetheine-phosphate adenylyltransferase